MREPNGSVHIVALVHGSATVPVPVIDPPLHVAVVPPLSNLTELNSSPEPTSPPAECTVSTRLLIVNVSCASSTTLRTENEQLYGEPIFTGLEQPLVKP